MPNYGVNHLTLDKGGEDEEREEELMNTHTHTHTYKIEEENMHSYKKTSLLQLITRQTMQVLRTSFFGQPFRVLLSRATSHLDVVLFVAGGLRPSAEM